MMTAGGDREPLTSRGLGKKMYVFFSIVHTGEKIPITNTNSWPFFPPTIKGTISSHSLAKGCSSGHRYQLAPSPVGTDGNMPPW